MFRKRSLGGAVQSGRSYWPKLLNDAFPVPAARWAGDALHANAMVIGVAARVALDFDNVTRLQRFTSDAVAAQLAAGAPFHCPDLHLALVIRRFDVHERMRVAIQELYQLPLDGDRLILKISGHK